MFSLTVEEFCPRCAEDVKVKKPWGKVVCPVCGLKGCWDENCTEDYLDCWEYVEWDEF